MKNLITISTLHVYVTEEADITQANKNLVATLFYTGGEAEGPGGHRQKLSILVPVKWIAYATDIR